MTIIGGSELAKRIKREGLINNLSKREITNPEGPGFDLRIREVYTIKGKGFLGIEERKTAEGRLIASAKSKNKKVIIKPKDYFLISTMEELKMPADLFATIYPRSTLFRSGLLLLSGKVSPGYWGKLTFGLTNLGQATFEIEIGARIAFISFSKLTGKTNLSRGQWRGGRVLAKKKEKQI